MAASLHFCRRSFMGLMQVLVMIPDSDPWLWSLIMILDYDRWLRSLTMIPDSYLWLWSLIMILESCYYDPWLWSSIMILDNDPWLWVIVWLLIMTQDPWSCFKSASTHCETNASHNPIHLPTSQPTNPTPSTFFAFFSSPKPPRQPHLQLLHTCRAFFFYASHLISFQECKFF